MKNHIHNNFIFQNTKGSFTLETAIVFPLIIICVIGAIYIPVILYKKTSIQALTHYSTRRGIRVWDDVNKDVNTGKNQEPQKDKNGEKYSLYWNLYDKNKANKEEKLNNWLVLKLKSNSLLFDEDINVNVYLENYFIFQKLNSEIISYHKIPIGTFGKKYFQVKSNSEFILNNPTDFTRNVDLFIEIEKELEEKYQDLRELMDKIRKIIKDTTKNVEKFGGL